MLHLVDLMPMLLNLLQMLLDLLLLLCNLLAVLPPLDLEVDDLIGVPALLLPLLVAMVTVLPLPCVTAAWIALIAAVVAVSLIFLCCVILSYSLQMFPLFSQISV